MNRGTYPNSITNYLINFQHISIINLLQHVKFIRSLPTWQYCYEAAFLPFKWVAGCERGQLAGKGYLRIPSSIIYAKLATADLAEVLNFRTAKDLKKTEPCPFGAVMKVGARSPGRGEARQEGAVRKSFNRREGSQPASQIYEPPAFSTLFRPGRPASCYIVRT